ncbi:hypothetical protein WN944_009984 [Citrus x changshan-huyou]|uniref:Uncharacterized protein n=1 Tax=Citrus x changshan-huyou TaxID=2935761 RepID=A0AAP0MX54_9ROSI
MAAEYEHSSHMVVAILKSCTSVSHIYMKAPMERHALHAATMHIDLCKFNHTLSVGISILISFFCKNFAHSVSSNLGVLF